MKLLFLLVPFLFLLGCKNENANDKNDEPDVNVQVEPKNDPPREPDFYIAWRDDPNGPIYLTDSDADIDKLIVDLKPFNVEVGWLDRSYWKADACRRQSARKCVVGDCAAGNCEQTVVGGWNVCRCRL